MWMGICILMNLGTSSGQIFIIPVDTTVGAEVSIHTLGAISVGMVALFLFPICSKHLFSMPVLFLAYIAAIHDGGLASGKRAVLILKNCLFACEHVMNCCSEISTAFVLS